MRALVHGAAALRAVPENAAYLQATQVCWDEDFRYSTCCHRELAPKCSLDDAELYASCCSFHFGWDGEGRVLNYLPAEGRVSVRVNASLRFRLDTAGQLWEHAFATSQLLVTSLRPGARVLEVGAGSGLLSLLVARLGGTAVATDRDPEAVAAIRRNAAKNRVPVEALRWDVAEPFPRQERFDLALLSGVEALPAHANRRLLAQLLELRVPRLLYCGRLTTPGRRANRAMLDEAFAVVEHLRQADVTALGYLPFVSER